MNEVSEQFTELYEIKRSLLEHAKSTIEQAEREGLSDPLMYVSPHIVIELIKASRPVANAAIDLADEWAWTIIESEGIYVDVEGEAYIDVSVAFGDYIEKPLMYLELRDALFHNRSNPSLVRLREGVACRSIVPVMLPDRKTVLLQAAFDLLMKQRESDVVLNLLEETVIYDEADVENGQGCDGLTLMEDIATYFTG